MALQHAASLAALLLLGCGSTLRYLGPADAAAAREFQEREQVPVVLVEGDAYAVPAECLPGTGAGGESNDAPERSAAPSVVSGGAAAPSVVSGRAVAPSIVSAGAPAPATVSAGKTAPAPGIVSAGGAARSASSTGGGPSGSPRSSSDGDDSGLTCSTLPAPRRGFRVGGLGQRGLQVYAGDRKAKVYRDGSVELEQ